MQVLLGFRRPEGAVERRSHIAAALRAVRQAGAEHDRLDTGLAGGRHVAAPDDRAVGILRHERILRLVLQEVLDGFRRIDPALRQSAEGVAEEVTDGRILPLLVDVREVYGLLAVDQVFRAVDMPHGKLPQPHRQIIELVVKRLGKEQVVVPVVGVPEEGGLGRVLVALAILRILTPSCAAVGAIFVERDEVHRFTGIPGENARLHIPVGGRFRGILYNLPPGVPVPGVGDLDDAATNGRDVGPEIELPAIFEVHRLPDTRHRLGREFADATIDRFDEPRQRIRQTVANARIGEEARVVGGLRHRGDRRRVAIRPVGVVVERRLHHVGQQVRFQDQRHRRAAGELPDRVHRELQILEILHQERPILQVGERNLPALVGRHEVVVDDLRHRSELRALPQRLDQLLAVKAAAARSPGPCVVHEGRRRGDRLLRRLQRPVVQVDVLRVEALEASRVAGFRPAEEVLRIAGVGVDRTDRQPLRLGGHLPAGILDDHTQVPRRDRLPTGTRVGDPQRDESAFAGERSGVDRERPLVRTRLLRDHRRHDAGPVHLHLERRRLECQVGRV